MIISKPLSFLRFLTTPLFTTISTPARAEITSALLLSILATEVPTVPTPMIPIFIIIYPHLETVLKTLLYF